MQAPGKAQGFGRERARAAPGRSARLFAAALLAAVQASASPSLAVSRAPGAGAAETMEFLALGEPGAAPARLVSHSVPTAAQKSWQAFLAQVGPNWVATWDRITGVPHRIVGAGVSAPGAVASAEAAARFARRFLARHLELLAPGSRPGDFVLVANDLDGDLRTVGFHQYHRGMRVLGGQVNFRFKNDRLFVIGSEGLPLVRIAVPRATISHRELGRGARAALFGRGDIDDIHTGQDSAILPVWDKHRLRAYRVVKKTLVTTHAPLGRWEVYLDAATGDPVARLQTLRFASASVSYNVSERRPTDVRSDRLARGAAIVVDGVVVVSDEQGSVAWPGNGGAAITTRVQGPLVRVHNHGSADAMNSFAAVPGDRLIWRASDDEVVDAQLHGFIHGRTAKDYARQLAPARAFLDRQLQVTVNIADKCNAFSDGETINFFRGSSKCENTGRLADVIYHEFGHVLHFQSIIEGAGAFDIALSEGLSDYFAATITGDPGMGRGFFYDDAPLRHLDPPGLEYTWPEDIAEVHKTGLIIAGALWDLRKALVARYGGQQGVRRADELFYAVVRRASSIPAARIEVLAADDDDGDLSNGTPNECEINAAFSAHGLRGLSLDMRPPAAEPPSPVGFPIELAVANLSPRCPAEAVASGAILWHRRDQLGQTESVALANLGGRYRGVVPAQPAGTVVKYQIRLEMQSGHQHTFPSNAADSWYEFLVGEVTPLYCTDFEQDPWQAGWSHALERGGQNGASDDWQWGEPAGLPASGDPVAARSGTRVLGNDLGGGGSFDGLYEPDRVSHALSPAINVGNYSDIRIHYWRWLTVEDGFFDQARLYANDVPVWQNFNSQRDRDSTTHHQDNEWRFHDVPISWALRGDTVQVKFELRTDAGLELGGWTIDDFCLVAVNGSVCGDGHLTGAEQCDKGQGNSDALADACRSNCKVASCGDGVVDSGEECDGGGATDHGICTPSCRRGENAGGGFDWGCRVAGRGAVPSHLLGWAALCALVLPRRRLRRRPGGSMTP